MWNEAVELLERADRLQRQFFQLEHGKQSQPNWAPPIDMFETGDELVIVAAVPGIPADQLQVGFEEETLVIRGRRPLLVPRDSAVVRRLEIPYGQFERRVALPAGRYQTGQQVLKDGCLVLTLNKLG
jgi:HSP20 family molecular chaperone IbpA